MAEKIFKIPKSVDIYLMRWIPKASTLFLRINCHKKECKKKVAKKGHVDASFYTFRVTVAHTFLERGALTLKQRLSLVYIPLRHR